jgi:aryl-alcohol dehydrogenase-like predicted oxidoreductase
MGGGRFHLIPFAEGTARVRRAYDLGITYFDMARGYYKGHAEEVYGAVIPEFRKNIFLTSKSGNRTRAGAEADLDLSLKTMHTDHLDLWQMHSVGKQEDIDKILGPGGALEAFVAAKKAGKVRFFGFTGHADPAINLKLLRSYDGFDTMLMPLHVSDSFFLSFEKNALPPAVERGIGVLGMKIFGSAYLLRTFSVEDCLSYTLNLPVSAVPLGFTTPGQLEDDVRIAQKFKPLSSEAVEALRARAHADIDVMGGPVAHGPAVEFWKQKQN